VTLSRFAYQNLLRRPARTLLTILAITLAVGTVVALLALSRGVVDGVARGLDERGAELVVQPRSAADIMTSRMPQEIGTRIAAIDGVKSVSGELYTSAISGDHHLLVAGRNANSKAWSQVPLKDGRMPAAGESAVVLGDVLALGLDVAVGDTIDLFDEDFKVVGISQYATAINRSLAIMPLQVLQEAALRPGQVSLFLVELQPNLGADRRAEIKTEIAATDKVIVSEAQEVLEQDGNLAVLIAVSDAVSIIALAMGALSLFAALLTSVQERTREIGMLAALGWSDGRIIRLIVTEGVIMGLAGCLLGVVAGIAASAFFDAIPTIGGLISFSPRLDDLALPLLLALPVCALGSAYPALRAVRLLPAEALRSV